MNIVEAHRDAGKIFLNPVAVELGMKSGSSHFRRGGPHFIDDYAAYAKAKNVEKKQLRRWQLAIYPAKERPVREAYHPGKAFLHMPYGTNLWRR